MFISSWDLGRLDCSEMLLANIGGSALWLANGLISPFVLTACICLVFMCVCVSSYVMMMPFKRQALVEFSAVESADRCVSCGAKEPVYIAGLSPRTD